MQEYLDETVRDIYILIINKNINVIDTS